MRSFLGPSRFFFLTLLTTTILWTSCALPSFNASSGRALLGGASGEIDASEVCLTPKLRTIDAWGVKPWIGYNISVASSLECFTEMQLLAMNHYTLMAAFECYTCSQTAKDEAVSAVMQQLGPCQIERWDVAEAANWAFARNLPGSVAMERLVVDEKLNGHALLNLARSLTEVQSYRPNL